MYRYIVTLIFVYLIIASCNSNADKQINALIKQGAKLDSTHKLLQGKWVGYYQELSPTYDTLYHASIEERLDYVLSDSVINNSLVKEIKIKDSFKLKPIEISFLPEDSSTWTSLTYIKFNSDSLSELQSTLNIEINFRADLLQIRFGNPESSLDTISKYVISEMPDEHKSIQDALSSQLFKLTIKKLSNDSLILSLPNGYGNLKLAKE